VIALGSLAMVLVAAHLASAAPGDLDPSFGHQGKLVRDLGDEEHAGAVAIQDDGRIVVAGDVGSGRHSRLMVARMRRTGRLDRTFAGDGVKLVDLAGPIDYGASLAIDDQGRIVVAGTTGIEDIWGVDYSFGVARLRPGGRLDRTFDHDGIRSIAIHGGYHHPWDSAEAIAIQTDGRIVIAGWTGDPLGAKAFALARLRENGSLDDSFSADGQLITRFNPDYPELPEGAGAVASLDDGRIIVAGTAEGDFAMARYLPTGELDDSFSQDGRQTTDFHGRFDGAADLAILGDGRILAAGSANAGGGRRSGDFGLARYAPDGTLDASLSGDGLATADIAGRTDRAAALAVQADGRVLVTGGAERAAGKYDLALARFLTDGEPDASFSGDGRVTVHISRRHDLGEDLALDRRGRAVVVGTLGNGDATDTVMARLQTGG
jgi:uncharacterized delta-60 repeat protein